MTTVTMADLMSFKMTDLQQVLAAGVKEDILKFLTCWGLTIKSGKIVPAEDSKAAWDDVYEYFDKKQLVRKISLNSAFLGAFVW
jgi:hypothetical protein